MFTVKRKFPCYLLVANSQHNFDFLNVLVRYQFFIRIQTFFFDFKNILYLIAGKTKKCSIVLLKLENIKCLWSEFLPEWIVEIAASKRNSCNKCCDHCFAKWYQLIKKGTLVTRCQHDYINSWKVSCVAENHE